MNGQPMSTASFVADAIRRVRFNCVSEDDLQRGIEKVLTDVGMKFEREVILSPRDRLDFVVDGLGIEVKIAGGLNDVMRQVQRYLGYEQIKAVMVVSTRSAHNSLPDSLRGKPVHVVVLRTGLM